jgi:hypothetical protein
MENIIFFLKKKKKNTRVNEIVDSPYVAHVVGFEPESLQPRQAPDERLGSGLAPS